MTISEAAIEIRNQSPIFASAYLWTFIFLLAFCAMMGILETVKKRKG